MTAGNEVPYSAGQGKTNYRSVGVSIGCTLKEIDGNPWLESKLSISDVAPPDKGGDQASPVFRSITIPSKALLSLGKPVTVSSVEDPSSKRRFMVDVTATNLK